MRHVEVSPTFVFDAPRHVRGFFEALIADNLDLGRPHNVETSFRRRIRRDTPGTFAPPSTTATTVATAQRLLQALPDQTMSPFHCA